VAELTVGLASIQTSEEVEMRHGLRNPLCRVVMSVTSLVVGAVLFGFVGACGGGDGEDETPRDPFFMSQWHLENTGQMGGMPGADIKARGAWQQGATGRGVTIAIFDDGVQTSHEDLREHLQILPGANLGSSTAPDDPGGDPRFDAHGTSVAGVAVAAANEVGVRGIAYDATLMPFRWGDLDDPLESSVLAAAFRRAADSGAAILSNSWGPPDRAGAFPLPDVFSSAFDYVTRQGRQGRGAMIFFAAGNGNEDVGDDGFASDPRAVAVGASDDLDVRSSYSDFGAALDIAAPSNDTSRAGIWSTDRMGLDGFNSGALGPGDYAIGVRSLGPALDYDLIVGPGTTRVAELEPNNSPQQRQDVGVAATGQRDDRYRRRRIGARGLSRLVRLPCAERTAGLASNGRVHWILCGCGSGWHALGRRAKRQTSDRGPRRFTGELHRSFRRHVVCLSLGGRDRCIGPAGQSQPQWPASAVHPRAVGRQD
jgi:subtilisin family serine protease